MVTEDYCSFEVSKLLKEKGFDGKCYKFHDGEDYLVENKSPENWNEDSYTMSIPTHQMACKWLREKGICISIIPFCEDCGFDRDIYQFTIYIRNGVINGGIIKGYSNAVEAALKYALEHLS